MNNPIDREQHHPEFSLPDNNPTILYKTKPCVVCHKRSELLLDLEKFNRWQAGEHVQNVWPEMSADEREVLISGTHPKCWDILWKDGQ